MQTPQEKDVVGTQLTQEQKKQLKRTATREGETIELEVEELEERIAPRLAQNHNETLLVDR